MRRYSDCMQDLVKLNPNEKKQRVQSCQTYKQAADVVPEKLIQVNKMEHIRHVHAINESLHEKNTLFINRTTPTCLYMSSQYQPNPCQEVSSESTSKNTTPYLKSSDKSDVYEKLMKRVCPSQKLNMDFNVNTLLTNINVDEEEFLQLSANPESTFKSCVQDLQDIISQITSAPIDKTAKYTTYEVFLRPFQHERVEFTNLHDRVNQLAQISSEYVKLIQKNANSPLLITFEQKLVQMCALIYSEEDLAQFKMLTEKRNGLKLIILEEQNEFVVRQIKASKLFVEKLQKREKLTTVKELFIQIYAHYRRENGFVNKIKNEHEDYTKIQQLTHEIYKQRDEIWAILE
ncbi:Hypothetical_protein [Hexamita inflata]|uniref:Hypothetical_protein n=1 Tax=Hexamita inflata TaxID=28002 RepID=A0AA86Q484_9EUKA|nr:Hypothetical protein HINF_LOCUS33625 [Hexamita inflata]